MNWKDFWMMIRWLLILSLGMLAGIVAARANQIDYLFICPDEPTCIADPAIGKYHVPADSSGDPASWNMSSVLPGPPDGPLSVFQITGSQTITVTNLDGSQSQQTVPTTQAYPGWPVVISVPGGDPALDGNQYEVLKTDRDMANAGNPGFMLYAAPNLTQSQFNASVISPTFAGSRYPFGNTP